MLTYTYNTLSVSGGYHHQHATWILLITRDIALCTQAGLSGFIHMVFMDSDWRACACVFAFVCSLTKYCPGAQCVAVWHRLSSSLWIRAGGTKPWTLQGCKVQHSLQIQLEIQSHRPLLWSEGWLHWCPSRLSINYTRTHTYRQHPCSTPYAHRYHAHTVITHTHTACTYTLIYTDTFNR